MVIALRGWMDNCFCCGKSGHKVRNFPIVMSQDKSSGRAQESSSNEAPKKNQFYALRSLGGCAREFSRRGDRYVESLLY